MGIIVNENTRAIVQGITGRQGSFHTNLMLEFGTRIVAGVTPGKGGQTIDGVPIFDTVAQAKGAAASALVMLSKAALAPSSE